MRLCAVLDRLALLQFALLFLPALIVTLSIYGSEFGLSSGRLVVGLVAWLPVQALVTRPLARRVVASPTAWNLVCVATALLVSWAYRPLHFGWWDERSVPHALGMVAIGTASLFLSSCAAARVRAAGRPLMFGLPGALALSALPWFAAQQHPYFIFFGVVLAAASGLASGAAMPFDSRGAAASVTGALPQGVLLWALALASIDLSLPVWERSLDGGFGAVVAVALVAAGLGASLPRARGALLVAGGVSFLAACAFPIWILHPVHQVFAGAALGAALSGLELRERSLPLSGVALCVGVAWLAAYGLSQNLVFAAARALLVLPPALLWWRWWKSAKL